LREVSALLSFWARLDEGPELPGPKRQADELCLGGHRRAGARVKIVVAVTVALVVGAAIDAPRAIPFICLAGIFGYLVVIGERLGRP